VIAVVFQFEIKPGREDEFEQFHGADGEWTALSRQSRSFIGSSFLREFSSPPRYLLIEYWSEMIVYEHHRKNLAAEMGELERRRTDMVSSTTSLGIYHALDVPDRFGPTWSQRDGR
jgi:quinol monooxygenase YgiN